MQWFGPEIKCIPISCDDPGEILNGYKEGSCFTFSCRVTYHCRPGFELVGRGNLYCQHDGTWSPSERPACTPVQCDIPEDPENGKSTFTRRIYNSVVSYKCDYSYMLVGPETRRCGPDKKWSGVQPQCKQINCGHPGHLPNGWLENIEQGTALGSSIIFRCFANMTIEGDQSTVCQADGTWSKPLPKCLAPCIVPTIEHGRLKNRTLAGALVTHGSVIEVDCDERYELAYSLAPSLCYNGTWTHYPRCQPARCKKLPPRPRHGMVIAPRTDHGMWARYRCRDGYQLHGNATTKCKYGNWTGSTPTCVEVYCPFPGEVANGRVLLVGNMGMYDYRSYVKKVRNNRQIRYDCDRGYYLVEGPPGATCVAGQWSPKEMPRCDPDLHPRIRWVKRSVDSREYEEIRNQTVGESRVVSGGGDALGQAPASDDNRMFVAGPKERPRKPARDQDPIINEHERVRPFTFKVNSKPKEAVSTSTAPPPRTTKPTASATPGTAAPTPARTTSEAPRKVVRDALEVGKKLKSPLYDFYRLLRVENDSSSEVGKKEAWPELVRVPRGAAEREKKDKKRKQRNKWKKKGKKVPRCQAIPSQPYLRVEVARSGRDKNYTYSAGARIKVTCLHGYGLNIGNKTAKCAKGKWKPKKPECVTLPCSVPKVAQGQFDFNGEALSEGATISHGEVVKFSCQAGYNVLGSETMRCWYGAWAVTGQNPKCQPDQCVLPKLDHGKYTAGYKKGLTIIHGSTVEYMCDEGWIMSADEVTCQLGKLVPSPPACIAPARSISVMNIAPAPVKREGPPGGDIPDDEDSKDKKRTCGAPPDVLGALAYRGDQLVATDSVNADYPHLDQDQRYSDGTQINYACDASLTSENYTWMISCQDGIWDGEPPVYMPCGDGIPPVIDFGNISCIWRKTEPNVVTFYNDQEVTEEMVEFEPGAKLVSRCVDIGKYALEGSVERQCIHGQWTGNKSVCVGLNQESNYSLDKPPTILFRNEKGPMAQSNDGKLVVYPGTVLHLECLFTRRHGTPNWNVSLASAGDDIKGKRRKKTKAKGRVKGGKKRGGSFAPYPNGWANAPNRNIQLEYRLSIYRAQPKDSGSYACVTPKGHKHVVTLDIRRVHCPNINVNESDKVIFEPNETKMNTIVKFSCEVGYSLVGASEIKCLPSGNWSAPFPRCEDIECPDPRESPTDPLLRVTVVARGVGSQVLYDCPRGHPVKGPTSAICQENGQWSSPPPRCKEDNCIPPAAPANGTVTGDGPFHAGDMVVIKCNPNFMLEGQSLIVCQEDGTWSEEIPKCSLACTYPGTIISGIMSPIKFYYPINDTITYTCNPRNVLRGVRSITCMEGGKWSAPVPTCIPEE
ncbi:complement receptor type 2-like isoform X1 [Penaeus monodon]|uniref:complement receptor type 2-like isoform X1 n=1 Tax=Penaeus monodon TaxID=6687 RepID=UPI0018A7A78E|nr:complement receptor type 2-like isoform X1 [Penaeus monodon]